MFELTVKTHFAAAHQLKMVAEKCENLHGHNWKIDVTVAGNELNEAGVIIDFGELKIFIEEIMNELDHKFLNELEFFKDGNPSSENVAVHIAQRLQKSLDKHSPAIRVASIAAWESDNACAKYFPPVK